MAKDKKTEKGTSFLSKEDKRLWHKVASTVQRYLHLDETTEKDQTSFAELMGDTPKKEQVKSKTKPTLPKTNVETKRVVSKEEPEIDSGVDGRTITKLKRGQLPIEGILDLHGMTLDKAHTRCISFLKGAQINGYRCVLIITGKGRFSKDKVGVIKKHFPEWMYESPLSKIVLSFAPAQIKDGGEGAFYVLLRKIK